MQSIAINRDAGSLNSTASTSLGIPLYLYATVFSSLCVAVGINWDISWHMSIGRDGLLSPPHLAVYLGAVIAGAFSAVEVFRISFWGGKAEQNQSVKFWGIFHGSLGSMYCIWGALAMLTSAPFDDWWHNTYGLDVTILSPPHTVLAMGIIMTQIGAMVSVLAVMNRSVNSDDEVAKKRTRLLAIMFAVSAGLLMVMVYTLFSEYLRRGLMRSALFYYVTSIAFPIFMVAASKAYPGRWGATLMASVYMIFMMLMVWILPLFPAEPLLGPILNHVTTFQAFHFPLLLIVPALAIDYLHHKMSNKNAWLLSLGMGVCFVLLVLAVQWNFGAFLNSPAARGWFFGQGSWFYQMPPDYPWRFTFNPDQIMAGWGMVQSIGIAILFATLSSRLGLAWGNWMKQVQR